MATTEDSLFATGGPAPYVAFVPAGADGWGTTYIQLGVNETGNNYGNYFAFLIGDNGGQMQFFFNRNVVLGNTGRIGLGTTYPPQYDIDIAKPVPLGLALRGLSSTAVAQAILLAGDGTTSTQKAGVYFIASQTASKSWYAGLFGGNGEFRIRDGNTDRMVIDGSGNVTFSGTVYANYQDVAEWVPSRECLDPGTVVILDPERSNGVTPSVTAYDTRAAGVVSAQPGILLGRPGEDKAQIATTGRVRVNVDATQASIRVGDLLVTSDKAGFAMKSEPVDVAGVKMHRPGTIIGKALEPMDGGTGQILVLLSLQ